MVVYWHKIKYLLRGEKPDLHHRKELKDETYDFLDELKSSQN